VRHAIRENISGVKKLAFTIAAFLLSCSKSEPAEQQNARLEFGKPEPGASATAAALASASESDRLPGPPSDQPSLLDVGAPAPNVEATAHNGEKVKLSDLKGKPVVVYFYPKDNTPGCTVEAQEIRDLWKEIKGTQAVVIGVSTDDEASHQAFAQQYDLPFLLVPDERGQIAAKFGVPLVNGKARRVTFVIGKDGAIARVFPEVKPQGHGHEILEAVKAI
jgi:peroxiredoxin Q/BCP